MSAPDLYRLPTEGRMGFRKAFVEATVVYLAALVVAAGVFTQRFAHLLDYHPNLTPVLLPTVDLAPTVLGGLALLLVVAAFAAVFFRPVASVPLLASAYLPGALAFGPLYVPTNVLLWAYRYRDLPDYAPLLFPPLRLLALLAVAGLVPYAVVLVRAARAMRIKADIHGSAQWANEKDVRRSGLLDAKTGLLLGIWGTGRRRRYLRHDGPEHAFVFAPTRSGKGVGLVVPNLLTWPGSVIVHDIKGENWALSAGWRAKALGSVCLRFDPTDTSGTAAHYNPLLEIRLGPLEVRDAQTVADILVDPNGERLRDHWDRTAHELLTGLILHVLYSDDDPTLHACATYLTNPSRTVVDALDLMMKHRHDTAGRQGWIEPSTREPTLTHPVVAAAARALLDKSENERSGVISTALSFLALYRDPVVAANTADSAFRIRDLMNHERPVSLYLTVPSSDLSRTRPLVRMLLNQICRRLTEELRFEQGRPVPHYRYPLLMMLDEFPALGRLAFFAESLAFLAGYGIRVFLIAQDLSQLYGLYGRDESITGNCHIRIAFAPNKPETAELLSRMAGVTTVHQERTTFRGDRFDLLMNQQSRTQVESQRQLLTADECMRLPDDELLLFLAGQRPIRARKIRYYQHKRFAARAAIPATGKHRPSKVPGEQVRASDTPLQA